MKRWAIISLILLTACGEDVELADEQTDPAGQSTSVDSSTGQDAPPQEVINSFVGIWKFDIDEHLDTWQSVHHVQLTPDEIQEAHHMYADCQFTIKADGTYDLWFPDITLNGPGTWAVTADKQWLTIQKANTPTIRFFVNYLDGNKMVLLPDGALYWPVELETLEFKR